MSSFQANFIPFQTKLYYDWEKQFKSGPILGEFSYKIGGPTSLYGTTDMVFNRYILNDFDLSESEKDSWANIINQFQDPKTGWFRKKYTLHYKEHGTAYAVAALTLLDRQPRYPLKFLDPILKSQKTMEKWINHISWSLIWPGSHVISGIPACMLMTDYKCENPFFDWYFDWLNREVDKRSGFWCRGLWHKLRFWKVASYQDMGGAFHMYYIYEFCNRKWPYPKQIIDQTLALQHVNGLWDDEVTYCIDLDGVYSLLRSCRNTNGYRSKEIQNAIQSYLETAERILNDRNFFYRNYRNSHILPGALAAIAECQKFYPKLVNTSYPWRQSLDEACFI